MIIVQCFSLILGFCMLLKGSDWFVDGASHLASRLGIPQIVIGLTIVAMGTSAPEAAVSISAALKGDGGIAMGNIVGSNILNILIILGISCLITALSIQKNTIWIETPYLIFVTIVLIAVAYFDGSVGVLDGIFLWFLFLVYLLYLYVLSKRKKEEQMTGTKPIPRLVLLLIGGLLVVILGSELTVTSAKEIARFFGVSERVIGLTIVAFGTSLPELFTSVTATKKNNADIAVGNIVGSNIFNILFIIGTAALITPVEFDPAFLIDAIVAILAGVILWLAIFKTKKLTWPWGIGMLVVYLLYLLYLL